MLILHGCAAAVIEVIAAVLWLSERRRTGPPAGRLGGRDGNVLLLAAAL